MTTPQPPKDFTFKTTTFKGNPYVEVKERVRYLREQWFGRYEIKTAFSFYPEGKMFVVHATLTLHHEGLGAREYQGLAQEIVEGKGVNSTSALENAETSAVGRACAMAGIGSEGAIASFDELVKAELRRAGSFDAVKDELKEEEAQRIWRESAETEFSLRVNSITTAAELTAIAKESKSETNEQMRAFKQSAIKLVAGLQGYVADKVNGCYVEKNAAGAVLSKQRGGAAVSATLQKLGA